MNLQLLSQSVYDMGIPMQRVRKIGLRLNVLNYLSPKASV